MKDAGVSLLHLNKDHWQDNFDNTRNKGNLIGAQPLVRDGKMISGRPDSFIDGPYNESKEIIVGYYHILARDMNEAIAIAKRNPEFAFVNGARIQVRPIKMVEESTSYKYPSHKEFHS